jgi:hypothetical protein
MIKKFLIVPLFLLSLVSPQAVGVEKETQDLQEDPSQKVQHLVEKGPAIISEGRPEEVLELVKKLPYKKRLDADIQVLECFAHLKRWVLYKDFKSKEEWWGIRLNLIHKKTKEATPMLIAFLKDREPWLRLYAAELLGFIGDERALDALENTGRGDGNHKVRKYANWAYGQILNRRP